MTLKSYKVYDGYEVSEKHLHSDKYMFFGFWRSFEKYKVGLEETPFDENQMSVS